MPYFKITWHQSSKMPTARCEICRQLLPTLKSLISHYLSGHSKFKLARQLLKLSILNTTPRILSNRCKNKTKKTGYKSKRQTKAETLYMNDNVQILYRPNEIIIRDDKSSVDMEFSFDENSSESKENYFVPVSRSLKIPKEENNNVELRKLLKINTSKMCVSTSSSSASSEDSTKRFAFKKQIKRKKDPRDKTRHYKINITRIKNDESLNETTGNFYLCHCREDNRNFLQPNDCKLTSDTESASDNGRNNFNLNVFCSKCGNGYREESALLEHMKIHEKHCRVCNEIFPTEQLFKQHIQNHIFKVFVCHICNYEFPIKAMLHKHFEWHMEDSVLESVVDMEKDYNTTSCNLTNPSYQSSINNILHFLSENHDIYFFSNKLMKIVCDNCLSEVSLCDYESHLQSVHNSYDY